MPPVPVPKDAAAPPRGSEPLPGAEAPPGVGYVVVCRGPHCRERGALPLRKRLVALLTGNTRVRLLGYSCFGQCEHGPNVAFYPQGVFYGGLSAVGDAERVVRHASGLEPLDTAPLRLPEAERSAHLRNIAELVSTTERDRRSPRRWWWPF